MVDDRLVNQRLIDDMLELHNDLERDNRTVTIEVNQYIRMYLSGAETFGLDDGITAKQAESFIDRVKDKTWDEVMDEEDKIYAELREAHRKGEIKDTWGRAR